MRLIALAIILLGALIAWSVSSLEGGYHPGNVREAAMGILVLGGLLFLIEFVRSYQTEQRGRELE